MTPRCSPPKAPTARCITDGGSSHAPGAAAAVPRDQAGDDGHVHLPGFRGDVLRQPLRRLLLSLRLASRVAAAAAEHQQRVLRQLVADPVPQHDHPAVERRDLPLRVRCHRAGQPAPVLHPSNRHDRLGLSVRVRAAVRINPGVRSRAEPDRQYVRERLLHHDGIPRRARAGRPGPVDPGPLSGFKGPVLFAASCRGRRGDALLALRRRGLDLPFRNPLPWRHSVPMKAMAVAMAAAALIAGCGGGSGPDQPSGSVKVTMTEFQFDPSTITTPSGKVVFYLVNAGSTGHDLVVRDSSGKKIAGSELVSAGDRFIFTIDNLPAGSYKIVCDQPGHEGSGMKGDLTVT